jgi:hypothetical protein
MALGNQGDEVGRVANPGSMRTRGSNSKTSAALMAEEPCVGVAQAGFEGGGSEPAECRQPRHVHQLARRGIGLGRIPDQPPLEPSDARHGLGQFANRAVHPRAHIDVAEHRLRVRAIGFHRQLHHMHTGRGHVVHVQELAHRYAAAPDHHRLRPALHRLVKAPQQRGSHTAVLGVEVVSRAVQVHAAVVVQVLAVEASTAGRWRSRNPAGARARRDAPAA